VRRWRQQRARRLQQGVGVERRRHRVRGRHVLVAADRQRLGIGGLGAELADQHVGQADPALGQVLAHLLVQHRRKHLGLLVVEHAVLRRGIAHALHHHVDEHRLELGGGGFQGRRRTGLGGLLQLAQALGVEREPGAEVGAGRIHGCLK
jgi:hypothetical protein